MEKKEDRVSWMIIYENNYLYIYLKIESIRENPLILTEAPIQLLTEVYLNG